MMSVAQDSPIAESLAEVRQATVRGAELCREMLAYTGTGRFNVQPLDVSAIVSSMRSELESERPASAEIEFDLQADLPPVHGDPEQMRQVVTNLVRNASDAIGQRPGRIRVATGSREMASEALAGCAFGEDAAPGLFVFLEIRDTGCGMDPATAAKVFEPFFTTKFAGRGLGLAAVQGIVRRHRGAVRVESEVGRGTAVTLFFPTTGRQASPAEGSGPAAGPAGPRTILVVDDEEEVGEVVTRMLENLGYRVLSANSGRDGVEAFRAHAADVSAIVLDLSMPDMGGDEVFQALRDIRAQVPILLASGYTNHESMARIVGADQTSFLQKPFEAQALDRALAALLAS